MALLRLLSQWCYKCFSALESACWQLSRVGYLFLASAAFNCFISRDLRRAALFRCRTPLLAARSSAATALRATSSRPSAPSPIARRNLVILVLTADLIDRLRRARAALRRASFLDEAMLAS